MVLEKAVWAGANLGSHQQAATAINELAEVPLTAKQIRRMTNQAGSDCVEQRREQVETHQQRPLMERITAAPGVKPSALMVVMMDGGRSQRRDHFRERRTALAKRLEETLSEAMSQNASESPAEKKTHWREDKIGIVLSMESEVHAADPHPLFPEWLAGARVVAELAQLAASEDEAPETASPEPAGPRFDDPSESKDWKDLAPKLLSRDVIASSQAAEAFGWHLEWKAWTLGVPAARRQAFVADGLAVNWTIHKQHFSQMTGILDLMHALSYAWRAAAAVEDPSAYRRYATWIWQGQVPRVIDELKRHQEQLGLPEPESSASDPRERIQRAITYYTNHQGRMNYPQYRQEGLPLTSSHIESTIKQINARVKGTEKFWEKPSVEAVLQLRADSLSDSGPLDSFWDHWRTQQTGTNAYRKLVI